MKTVFVLAALVLLAASAGPGDAAIASTFERNVDFLVQWLGPEDLGQIVTLPDGRDATLGEAVHIIAGRAGALDLSDTSTSTVGLPLDATPEIEGDVWILERGNGPCAANVVVAQPIEVPAWPYLWVHGGFVGDIATSHGSTTTIVSWTTGERASAEHTLGYSAEGSIDDYCVVMKGGHFSFPLVSGVSRINTEPTRPTDVLPAFVCDESGSG